MKHLWGFIFVVISLTIQGDATESLRRNRRISDSPTVVIFGVQPQDVNDIDPCDIDDWPKACCLCKKSVDGIARCAHSTCGKHAFNSIFGCGLFSLVVTSSSCNNYSLLYLPHEYRWNAIAAGNAALGLLHCACTVPILYRTAQLGAQKRLKTRNLME